MDAGLMMVFPTSIREKMRRLDWRGLEEIRVRIGWPVELIYDNRSEWLGNYECMIDRNRLDEMLNYITEYSLYAMEEELKQGYITYKGGHRIGVTGHATYETSEPQIKTLVDIGGLNIRIAHEKKECAKEILPHIRHGGSIYNTILFAAPGVGKTTYLRDIIRLLSNGDGTHRGHKICVVDERSEIAACVDGKPQNDLGKRSDVLDACPKVIGMQMALRTMSPDIIAVDELGKKEEIWMLEKMQCSGVKVLGTIHAGNINEAVSILKGRRQMIERYVELRRMEHGQRMFLIYDADGNLIWKQS